MYYNPQGSPIQDMGQLSSSRGGLVPIGQDSAGNYVYGQDAMGNYIYGIDAMGNYLYQPAGSVQYQSGGSPQQQQEAEEEENANNKSAEIEYEASSKRSGSLARCLRWTVFVLPCIFFLLVIAFTVCTLVFLFQSNTAVLKDSTLVLTELKKNQEALPFRSIELVTSPATCILGTPIPVHRWAGSRSGCVCKETNSDKTIKYTTINAAICPFRSDCGYTLSKEAKTLTVFLNKRACGISYGDITHVDHHSKTPCKANYHKFGDFCAKENEAPVTDLVFKTKPAPKSRLLLELRDISEYRGNPFISAYENKRAHRFSTLPDVVPVASGGGISAFPLDQGPVVKTHLRIIRDEKLEAMEGSDPEFNSRAANKPATSFAYPIAALPITTDLQKVVSKFSETSVQPQLLVGKSKSTLEIVKEGETNLKTVPGAVDELMKTLDKLEKDETMETAPENKNSDPSVFNPLKRRARHVQAIRNRTSNFTSKTRANVIKNIAPVKPVQVEESPVFFSTKRSNKTNLEYKPAGEKELIEETPTEIIGNTINLFKVINGTQAVDFNPTQVNYPETVIGSIFSQENYQQGSKVIELDNEEPVSSVNEVKEQKDSSSVTVLSSSTANTSPSVSKSSPVVETSTKNIVDSSSTTSVLKTQSSTPTPTVQTKPVETSTVSTTVKSISETTEPQPTATKGIATLATHPKTDSEPAKNIAVVTNNKPATIEVTTAPKQTVETKETTVTKTTATTVKDTTASVKEETPVKPVTVATSTTSQVKSVSNVAAPAKSSPVVFTANSSLTNTSTSASETSSISSSSTTSSSTSSSSSNTAVSNSSVPASSPSSTQTTQSPSTPAGGASSSSQAAAQSPNSTAQATQVTSGNQQQQQQQQQQAAANSSSPSSNASSSNRTTIANKSSRHPYVNYIPAPAHLDHIVESSSVLRNGSNVVIGLAAISSSRSQPCVNPARSPIPNYGPHYPLFKQAEDGCGEYGMFPENVYTPLEISQSQDLFYLQNEEFSKNTLRTLPKYDHTLESENVMNFYAVKRVKLGDDPVCRSQAGLYLESIPEAVNRFNFWVLILASVALGLAVLGSIIYIVYLALGKKRRLGKRAILPGVNYFIALLACGVLIALGVLYIQIRFRTGVDDNLKHYAKMVEKKCFGIEGHNLAAKNIVHYFNHLFTRIGPFVLTLFVVALFFILIFLDCLIVGRIKQKNIFRRPV